MESFISLPGCHGLLAWNSAHPQNVRKNEGPAPNLKKSHWSPAMGAVSLLLELSLLAVYQSCTAHFSLPDSLDTQLLPGVPG